MHVRPLDVIRVLARIGVAHWPASDNIASEYEEGGTLQVAPSPIQAQELLRQPSSGTKHLQNATAVEAAFRAAQIRLRQVTFEFFIIVYPYSVMNCFFPQSASWCLKSFFFSVDSAASEGWYGRWLVRRLSPTA